MSDYTGSPGGMRAGTGGVERLLQTVITLTRTMTEAADAGDFVRTTALMKEREKTLLEAAGLRGEGLTGKEGALLKIVQEENGRLMSTLQEQRTSIVHQLDGLKQERAIVAYKG